MGETEFGLTVSGGVSGRNIAQRASDSSKMGDPPSWRAGVSIGSIENGRRVAPLGHRVHASGIARMGKLKFDAIDRGGAGSHKLAERFGGTGQKGDFILEGGQVIEGDRASRREREVLEIGRRILHDHTCVREWADRCWCRRGGTRDRVLQLHQSRSALL